MKSNIFDENNVSIIRNDKDVILVNVHTFVEKVYLKLPENTTVNTVLYLKNGFFVVLSARFFRILYVNDSDIIEINSVEIINDYPSFTQMIKKNDNTFIGLAQSYTYDININN